MMTRLIVSACLVFLGFHPLRAEVRLLTGDANNNIHDHDATLLDLSADGELVLFSSGPPVSGSTPGIVESGLYVRRLSTDTLTFVGDNTVANSGVVEASFSDDGRYVAWRSANFHIYWRDTQSNITRLVTSGADGQSRTPILRADGLVVAFASVARNLIADTTKLPAANRYAVYGYDSQTETTTILSLAHDGSALAGGVGTGPNGFNEFDFSGNGQYLVFSSEAANAHPDRSVVTAGFGCIYRRDLSNGTLLLLNRNAAGTVSNGNFFTPRCNSSANRVTFFGGFVTVFGGAKMIDAVPVSFGSDMYVKDVSSSEVWWATKTTDNTAPDGVFGSFNAISGDGETVSFVSTGTKFVPENTDPTPGNTGQFDLFRIDLGTSGVVTTTLITKSPNGSGNVDYRVGPLLPGTGDYVAFSTSQVAAMQGTGSTDTINFQGFGVGDFSFLSGPPALAFSTWAAGLPPGKQGYLDNPSNDGVPNLTKYFMGMDAAVPDLSHLPVEGIQPGTALGLAGDTADYLTLQVRIRRALPSGFDWTVHASNTIAGLATDPGSAIQVGSPAANGDFDVYLFRFPTPLSGTGFMRVSLTAP